MKINFEITVIATFVLMITGGMLFLAVHSAMYAAQAETMLLKISNWALAGATIFMIGLFLWGVHLFFRQPKEQSQTPSDT